MVALTYSEAPAARSELTKTAPHGFFRRILSAMMEARLRQAQREIRYYQSLMSQVEAMDRAITKAGE